MVRARGGRRPRARLRATFVAAAAALFLVALLAAGCSHGAAGGTDKGGKVTLRVLFAGSLIVPFATVEQEYEAAHPDIDVNMEGHGSIQAIRIVSDIHEQADLVVSADYRLIKMLMYGTNDPDTKKPYADWSAIFATNKMALAYTADSKFAADITPDNWFEVINRPGVRLGISDPRLDSNGYRALMVIQLAESFYHQAGLFAKTFAGVFRVPLSTMTTDGNTVVTVPEILETVGGSHILLRPYSTSLLPLLSTGDVDYTFEYESVIRQHGLKYISLPPEINLGDPAQATSYAAVTVKLDYQRFASVKPEFTGEPVRYGATIPSNAAHPAEAAELLAFLLGPEGQKIMAENYQPVITPALTDNYDALPAPVKALCTPGG